MSIPSVNRVEINLAHLRHNYRQLRRLVGDSVHLLAMVKAEAYGHGLEQVALTLADAGAKYFGVAEVEEDLFAQGRGDREYNRNSRPLSAKPR